MDGPRFYCPALGPGIVTLEADESRHALQSLRLRPGDAFILFDGKGGLAHATLLPRETAGTKQKGPALAQARVERIAQMPPPARTLTLIVAGCKGARLDWLVEKCAELGVTRLVLAEFERSVVHVGPQHAEKLRRTALEACKQCGRAWLPEIETGAMPTAVVGMTAEPRDGSAEKTARALLVAEPADGAPWLGNWLNERRASIRHVVAVVGPEGGLTAAEVEMLRIAGGQVVRLAETILRVETAAVSVAANWAGWGRNNE